jgi:hypothetical protein
MTDLPAGSVVALDPPQAQLFLTLTATLDRPELVVALRPELEVASGTTYLHAQTYFAVRDELLALDPSELHRRLCAQGLTQDDLVRALILFGFPLTGVTASTPGWTVFIDIAEMGRGRDLWLRYSPDLNEAGAIDAFRQRFFPIDTEWAAYRPLCTVVPGRYTHTFGPPDQDEFHVYTSP